MQINQAFITLTQYNVKEEVDALFEMVGTIAIKNGKKMWQTQVDVRAPFGQWDAFTPSVANIQKYRNRSKPLRHTNSRDER